MAATEILFCHDVSRSNYDPVASNYDAVPSNYDGIADDLFTLVSETGALANLPLLGGRVRAGESYIPIFDEEWCVREDGVYDGCGRTLGSTGSILVARYLLQAGRAEQKNVWLPFRDLKDGALFASFIRSHIEERIARVFLERTGVLKGRMEGLGGVPYPAEGGADLSFVVRPLPRIPVLCLFRDREEEFPASFQFFFDASAPAYLDLESLAAALQYICLRITEGA